MKVLFISRRFYPEVIGGGQISGLYIAKAVKMQGNDVEVVTFSDKNNLHEVDGVKINVLKIPKLNLFPRFSNMEYMYYQMARLASDIIRRFNPDIIHLLNFESVPLAAIYYKMRFKKKIVATVNGPLFGCFVQTGIDYKGDTCIHCRVLKRYKCSTGKWGRFKGSLYYLYSLYYMKMLKLSYRNVDMFYPVSKAMVPLLMNMDIPRNKTLVVHNPINKCTKVATDLKSRLGINGKKIILYAGRLNETKGLQHVISALPFLKDFVFLILGEKRLYYNALKDLVRKEAVEDRVIFLGYMDNMTLGEYYSVADISILVQDLYESFSRFLLESCSYGVPIVASDIGGNTDIVENGVNGVIINDKSPKTISQAVIKAYKHRKKMSLEAKKKSVNFSPEKIGGQLCKSYAKLLSD
jgi:glycosyltransferase involved in cell wall biosynthesis